MDGLSAVAGVATAGVQLSKSLYDIYSTVRASRQEIQDVANNVSLLAMVLEELDGVLCDDELNYKPELREAAQSIVLRCASIFEDIRKHTGTDLDRKGKKFYEKLAWYFKRERVKPLRSSLESLKSTLNILLHVVQLAKSTRGVEEYPGVKPIGQWYVRKERRGLVCLVIDNRHAVERLKHLEDQTIQTDLDSIENEQPLAFADIFPLSASNHKRGQSPERKFVVAFRNPTGRKNGEDRRSQEPDIEVTQEDPSTPQNDVRSSPRDNQNHLHLSIDSDAQSFGRSTSSHTTRMPRAGTRPTKEQATYRLILDVIPHEQADETFKSAQNMSGSTILEAKAEETIDKLMRNWTYVDPKYFSEDDGLSTSSIEPSLSSLRHKTPKRSPRERRFGPADLPSGLLGNSIERGSQLLESKGAAKELERSQSVSLEEGTRTPSSLAAGQNRDAKRRPSPLLPTYKYLESSRGAKDKSTRRTPSDEKLENPKEPSTPAPPYLSSPLGSCSSCCTVAPSASISCADRHLCPLTSARAGGKEMGDEANASIDSALRLFESKMLEILKDRSLQHGALDRQLHHVPERQENDQQSLLVEQQAEPVILKDCLGRKFLFPFQTCRSWQSMENLIKRSFSHVESMNSRIFRGSYDILSPTGEIILPEIWEAVIKPGWVVELRFWDFSKSGEISQKDPDVDAINMALPVHPGSTTSRKSLVEGSSDVQPATAKQRASVRAWLGNRKSTPSVALQ